MGLWPYKNFHLTRLESCSHLIKTHGQCLQPRHESRGEHIKRSWCGGGDLLKRSLRGPWSWNHVKTSFQELSRRHTPESRPHLCSPDLAEHCEEGTLWIESQSFLEKPIWYMQNFLSCFREKEQRKSGGGVVSPQSEWQQQSLFEHTCSGGHMNETKIREECH